VVKAEQELSKFEKQLRETGLTAEQVGKKLQDAGKKMTDIGKDLSLKVTAPIVAAGAASFKMAADLQDAMGATEQIFKNAADSVKTWADNLESYYGIAEGEALEYANMMGTMLVNIGGLTEEQAAKQAQTLIELAGDLTAMYGGTTADAVRALTGALKGNNTMLDNYGMAANDAMIKTKALEMGLYDGTGQMDLATKQAATLALIMEQSAAAQGQAAREAEGASGGMRAFATEIKNLATDIGEVLLPIITPLINTISEWVQAFGKLSPEIQKAIVVIASLAAAIGPLLIMLGMMSSGLGEVISMATNIAGFLPKLGGAFAALTGPIGLTIAAITGLIAIGVLMWRNWDTIKAKAATLGEKVATVWEAIGEGVTVAAATISGLLLPKFAILAKEAAITSVKVIASWANMAASAIASAASQAAAAAKIIASWALVAAQAMANAVRIAAAWVIAAGPVAWVGAAIAGLAAIVATKTGWMAKIIEAVKERIVKAFSAIANAIDKLWKILDGEKENIGGLGGFRKLEEESKQAAASIDDLSINLDDLSAAATAGGSATAKAAEDTRAAWELAADSLSTRLQLVKAQQENAALAAELHGDRTQALARKASQLNHQLDLQRQIVAAVTEGYNQSVQAKGADAEETLKLALRLEQEKKAQAEIEKQIRDTTQAIKDQSQELRDLATEVTKVEEKYRKDLAAALDDYQRKVADVNDKIIEDERRVQAEYEKTLDNRARALRDFVGLFDEVTSKDVSGEQLLKNLRGQVDAFENWQENIADLAARGVDEGLIAELREMGPKAGPEIAALNTLTDDQLVEYVTLWRRKNQEAREEAVNQLQQQRVEMQQKLMEIRQAANEQLELYRAEWEKKNAEIRKNAEDEMNRIQEKFENIAKAGTTYGVSLVANFTAGMESQFDNLRRTLFELASIVDSYMPHSPAKRGPLSKIMEWGPALVGSLSEGIKKSMPQLEAAMRSLASVPASALAGGNTVSNYYNTSDNRVINITVQDGEDLLRTLHRLGVRIP
jgi:hypothetical protein